MEDKYLIVLLVIAIVFGASRLPSLGRNLGQGIREFRQGLAGVQREAPREDDPAATATPKPTGGDADPTATA